MKNISEDTPIGTVLDTFKAHDPTLPTFNYTQYDERRGRPNIAREERIEQEVEVCEARRRPQRREAACRGPRARAENDERTSTRELGARDAEPMATPRRLRCANTGHPQRSLGGGVHRTDCCDGVRAGSAPSTSRSRSRLHPGKTTCKAARGWDVLFC
ncbi:hypothetical protein ANCDUO_13189 [Ancylostoma duodenale]|uniref:Uncharacterized protein n=1 Tax=Ancylostoma duodenale TaxID=51022 RepID=A0A0C2CJJ5_9BILA|nr:hypothetical protein ANCDUO_13189 [Ancylostoma duodenale]